MVATYEDAMADLRAEIARLTKQVARGGEGAVSLTRLRGLYAALGPKLSEARVRLEATLSEATMEAAKAEDRRIATLMVDRLGLSWTSPPEFVIVTAAEGPVAASWRSRLAADLTVANNNVGAIIARALAKGASMADAAVMLREISGLAETYKDRMVVIARTEIQRAANDAAMANYTANGDVIKGVQWLATLDSRTCLRCAPRHNQVYPMVGGQVPSLDRRPPLHPRCRCFLAPVVKSYAELGLAPTSANRSMFDGEPARDQTFGAWLRRQPADVQLEVLGPTRLPMFRAGLPLDDFVVGDRLLRVDELRQRAVA
jgi:SPP1 gp7 family putative phage head morphogenesis protein